jgi:hypothetical protein
MWKRSPVAGVARLEFAYRIQDTENSRMKIRRCGFHLANPLYLDLRLKQNALNVHSNCLAINRFLFSGQEQESRIEVVMNHSVKIRILPCASRTLTLVSSYFALFFNSATGNASCCPTGLPSR